jgi:hypothetical protein
MSQLPDGGQITSQVASMLESAGAGSYRVFFTRHISLPKECMGIFQRRQAMAWQRTDSVDQVQH